MSNRDSPLYNIIKFSETVFCKCMTGYIRQIDKTIFFIVFVTKSGIYNTHTWTIENTHCISFSCLLVLFILCYIININYFS